MLPSDLRPDVVSAVEQEVRVAPGNGRQNPPTSLSHIMGAIQEHGEGAWTVCHQVVVVRIQHGTPRGPATAIQWPANVTIDGRPLIGE